jgi:hypothetical protein
LLELQKDLNETRRNMDDRSIIVQVLSTKVKTLEEQCTAPPPAPPIISKPTSTQQVEPEKKSPNDRRGVKKKAHSKKPALRRQVS